MEIKTATSGSFLVLTLSGEMIRNAECVEIERRLRELAGEGQKRIALFFSRHTYPYSRLIALLINSREMLRKQGGELAVVSRNAEFRKILGQAKLDQVFPIVSSVKKLETL